MACRRGARIILRVDRVRFARLVNRIPPRPLPVALLLLAGAGSAFALQETRPAPRPAEREAIVVGLPDPSRARGLLAWSEGRETDGFARRLLEAVARETDLVLDFRALPEGHGIAQMQAGEIDLICPASITQEHLEAIDFTAPILIVNGAVFVRVGTEPPLTVGDLRGQRVAVAALGIAHQFCLEKDIPVQLGPTLNEALRSVASGAADCVLTTQPAGRVEVERLGIEGLVDHPLDEDRLRQAFAFGVRKDEGDLAARLDYGLAVVRDRGEWDRLYERWVERYQPRARPSRITTALLASVSAVGALGLVVVLVLRARLSRRTRERDESEERYRAVAETLPALVHSDFVARDGRRERRFVTSNLEEWRTRFPGLDPGPDPRALLPDVHPEDRERYERSAARAQAETGRFDIEFRLRAADGAYRWLHSIATPIARTDGTLWQSLLLDTTPLHEAQDERQRLEQQLVEAQRLESLGLMAGGIAHDFNNLLMEVQGNIELARSSTAERERTQLLEQALAATRRAADRTLQLLVAAGEARLVATAVDLAAIAREVLGPSGGACAGRVPLELELAGACPLVHGDAALLREVVTHLVSNAVEAVREGHGGRVVVRVSSAEYTRDDLHGFAPSLPPGPYAELAVEDDGIGMDEGQQRRIFDPFFSTKFIGRGLGLALVQRTIGRHAGAMCVRSAPGRGACFRVLLPLAARPGAELRAVVPVARRGRAGRVLVIDDDERVLGIACAILEQRGWSADRAGDAHAAMALIRAQAPDVVLLDLSMPRMGGLDLLRLLRAEFPVLPVVLMSGYSEQESADEDGLADGFVGKPFSGDQLVAAMDRVLNFATRAHAHARGGEPSIR